ncbi:peptidoglycan D,D-transpeptidase FtsI family protein [Bifidobacterium sp.]|jgi:cell division protein FtsI (penicillin-binding protein 3)|uniref:peptidoglycan D,D-transpeptidase FtsI family protein n=1 Tax=Bifidobacterium sp. TaxID=41200 RepID=UPI0025BC28AC|nr:penicillin-binding protein 2 [Bifidobacterium sp.]MCH4209268.1 penicillin-binding protein 2 [Bifidobacterium sp.]MCI1224062.1 penicillin-binding protein 2 [Bifidobacterium sp.]
MSKGRISSAPNAFASRCLSISIILALISTLCIGQLASIQLLHGRSTAQAATASRTLPVTIRAQRGRILDDNGSVLAQSVERYTIVADPQVAQTFKPTTCTADTQGHCQEIDGKPVGTTGAAAVARLVAPALGMDALELGAKLSASSRYAVLKRDVTPEVKRTIDKLGLGGIVYGELSSERLYANGTMIGALLGGVDADGKGVAGIEQMENSTLTGENGYKVFQQGNGGEEIPGTVTKSKDAVDGGDVTLSINADVDWYVKKVLVEAKQHYQADWALAVVQEVGSGNILAIDDSDEITAGTDAAKLNVSKAVSQTFEPGSVGKVVSAAGMLQTGERKLGDKFTVPDQISKNGQVFHDSTSHATSQWTLAGILEQSSNVGMVMAADKYTNQQRYEFMTKFGFGQSSGLGLSGESRGTLLAPQQWDRRTQNTVLFGQGYAVNALQLTNAIATIANKGVRQQQSIVKSVTDANGHVSTPTKSQPTRVVDEDVAAQMMDAMESSAEHYQKFTGIDGYRIAGKSGTAEVAGPGGHLSSIIGDWSGIIPADNPRFVITVVMKNPHGIYGGLTSGPVFKQIGEFLMQKYEVPTSTPRKSAIPVDW